MKDEEEDKCARNRSWEMGSKAQANDLNELLSLLRLWQASNNLCGSRHTYFACLFVVHKTTNDMLA